MELLSGLRVVEGSAFVAAPLGGLTLAQLGADVIRFDTIGGGLDYRRWPVTDEGVSLYWAGLNKGKRSIAINLSKPEGRDARDRRSSPRPATTPASSSRTSRSRAGSRMTACGRSAPTSCT